MKMPSGFLGVESNLLRKRRRLGQHFLNSTKMAAQIVRVARVEGDVVVEIGAGKGILTRQLATRAKKVIAVEIDSQLACKLKDLRIPGVDVLNRDFLKVDLHELGAMIVVGNIPYSITSDILDKLVEHKNDINRVVLTMQKEYGDKMMASIGEPAYGYVTVYTNHHFVPRKEFLIPPRYFSPRPKVSSVVVSLEPRLTRNDAEYERRFFAFVAGIFRYRRKILKNAIAIHLGYLPDGIAEDALNKRPQHLRISDLHAMFQAAMEHEKNA